MATKKIEAIEVLQDGTTVSLSRGMGKNEITGVEALIVESVVFNAGDRIDPEEIDPRVLEALQSGDEWLASKLRILDKDEAEEQDERSEVDRQAQEFADELNAREAAGEGTFDPTGKTAQEVKDYLDGVSEAEVERVKDLEREGKGRTSILDYEPQRDTDQGSE